MSMDNIRAKGIEVEFAGKKRNMVFIGKGMRYLQDKRGGFIKSLNDITGADGDINFDILTDVIYASLLANPEQLSTEQVLEAIDNMDLQALKKLMQIDLMNAVSWSYPDKKAGSEKNA
jgi:hypothetical protein